MVGVLVVRESEELTDKNLNKEKSPLLWCEDSMKILGGQKEVALPTIISQINKMSLELFN